MFKLTLISLIAWLALWIPRAMDMISAEALILITGIMIGVVLAQSGHMFMQFLRGE